MFALAFPAALLILPLPFFVWYVLPAAQQTLPAALRVPFYESLTKFINAKKPQPLRRKSLYWFALIWSLMVFAASGPRWLGNAIPLMQEGHNIMLVLDLSASMDLDDMVLNGRRATRLSVVKRAAKQFVSQRVGDRLGLILFGSQAYLQTPLTYDHQNVLMRIDDATVGLAGKTTSIGDALGLAVKRLQNVPQKGRVIILLTDGANNSGVLTPLKAARLAQSESIKIYTIGLGSQSSQQGMNSLFFGLNPMIDLDEGTLKKVAKVGGGRYFYASDPRSLQEIYQTINRLETVAQENASVRPQQEYYPHVLALALLLWVLWFLQQSNFMDRFLLLNRFIRGRAA